VAGGGGGFAHSVVLEQGRGSGLSCETQAGIQREAKTTGENGGRVR